MEEHIEFNFIYSNDAVRVKAFLGSVPRSIECINYMDIFNKLTKNDFYQYEPSDAVVSSYLMRQLQNAIIYLQQYFMFWEILIRRPSVVYKST